MLFCKMLRDMRMHKTQFVSVFLMAFLGVFVYAGIGSEWLGLRQTADSFYKTTNLADVWLYGADFTQEDADVLESVPTVTGTERRLVLDANADLSGNPSIAVHFVEKNQISRLYLLEGEVFDTEKDGVWLDKRFVDARGLSLGDEITFTYNSLRITEEIKGIIYSPEYVYMADGEGLAPDFSQNGYAYLSYKEFPAGMEIPFTQLLVTTDTGDMNALENNVDTVLSGRFNVFLPRKNHASVSMFSNEIAQHRSMGEIFPVAFLAIALLTILTTMTRIVEKQRTQIGTLKALGFKKRSITLHYIGYGFWISLAGGVLGAVVGPLTLPRLFYPSMSGFYTLPEWKSAFDLRFFLMAGATVLLSALVTYLACRSVLRDVPAQTLRPKAPKAIRQGLLEKTSLWKRMDFSAKWNLRDIGRNKIRSLMAVVGVFGCTALLVCAFGMNDDMKNLKTWQYEEINRFSSKLSVDSAATQKQIDAVMASVNGQALMENAVEIRFGDEKRTGAVTVTDHTTLIQHTDIKQNVLDLPEDGISLSYKMASQLGAQKGDTIRWHLYGGEIWVDSTVDEIYRDPTAQGITLSRNHFESLGFTFTPTSIISAEEVRGSYEGITSIQNTKDFADGWDELTQAMMIMIYVLIAAASILAIVVLYNLGILSLTEMERDLATLKVIGIKARRLRRILLVQNLWLSAVGFILGLPGGKLLVDVMLSTMGDSFDMANIITPMNILLSLGIVLILSLLVNRMFYKKIRQVDMVSALKGAE